MKVTVTSSSGKEIIKGGLELADSATVADLQEAIHKRTKKYYPSRQRLTLPLQPGSKEKPIVLHYKKSLKDYTDGNAGNLTVVFKDLGPQVSYPILFFWEYLGPLIIYPIFYFLPVYQFFGYKGERVIYPVQTYALYAWCFHYFKRIMETFFVHRFSHATSPLSNVFRNCAYYWTFGAYIAYYVNHPLYTPVSDLQMKIGFGLAVVCQIANFYCHILLRNLRGSGSGGYQIPRGFLFNIVTCANYTTEIYQWLGFNIATQTVAGYVFLVVAASIMTNWALAKHRRLKRTSLLAVVTMRTLLSERRILSDLGLNQTTSVFLHALSCCFSWTLITRHMHILSDCIGSIDKSRRIESNDIDVDKLFDGKEGRPKYPRRWVILPPFL
ncbi:hypothetical protein RJ640_009325 [Escallonia rubra]|uniref:3-oxo-5-alpha-steroid 4-dehydrogenase C-terminal domain-containing protein n=1 Tax=Escallonia rubra TaxID=112253 RepID=A0AA88RAJ8_9ASTE|nr:hypothetical protein RJ640_009325 [Escallonia rubra]